MEQFASYTSQQWLLFFYFYCFLGWCFESTYVSLCEHRFVNRGFMRGPCLPIYGTGAIIMLFASLPVKNSVILIFLCGGTAATLLEYITGVCMEWLFKVRYWDYSTEKYNIGGYICLKSSLAWGGLAVSLVKILHVPVEQIILKITPQAAVIIADILTAAVAVDMALSVKAAVDIRNVLVQLAKVKEETEKLQHKLEHIIKENTVLSSFAAKRDIREQTLAEHHLLLQNKVQKIREHIRSQTPDTAVLSGITAKIEEIRDILNLAKERRRAVKAGLSAGARMLLRSSPSAKSKRYSQALTDLTDIHPSHDE